MARKIGDLKVYPGTIAVIACVLTILLSGCVSTEELYAQYDEQLCKLVVDSDKDGDIAIRDTISNTWMQWEPAVYFEFDKAELDTNERKKLESSVKILKKFPSVLLSLQGFTDETGSKKYNKKLAIGRVENVKNHLVSSGIAEERLLIQPIGEVLQTFGVSSETSRAALRRVELMILDENARPIERSIPTDKLLLSSGEPDS